LMTSSNAVVAHLRRPRTYPASVSNWPSLVKDSDPAAEEAAIACGAIEPDLHLSTQSRTPSPALDGLAYSPPMEPQAARRTSPIQNRHAHAEPLDKPRLA
jgi:hypothetical protein